MKQRFEAAGKTKAVDKLQRDEENEERDIDRNGVSVTKAGRFWKFCMTVYECRNRA